MTETMGNLVRFTLLPLRQQDDTAGIASLILGIGFDGLTAKELIQANWFAKEVNKRRAEIIISQTPQRKAFIEIDREFYKQRCLIEDFSVS